MTLAQAEERRLLRRVYAEPADDGPRQVYADMLQTRGDPRGDFIALQLAAAQPGPGAIRARAAADRLLARHRRSWLVEFEDAIDTKSAVFERGFLARCRLRLARNADVPRLLGTPAWATLQSIDFASSGRVTASMRGLEEARRVPDVGLTALARTPFPRLRVLTITDGGLFRRRERAALGEAHSRGIRALRDARGLPALGELGLAFGAPPRPAQCAWVFEAAWGPRLRVLEAGRLRDEAPNGEDGGLRACVAEWTDELVTRETTSALRRVILELSFGTLSLDVDRGRVVAALRSKPLLSGSWFGVDTTALEGVIEDCARAGAPIAFAGVVASESAPPALDHPAL